MIINRKNLVVTSRDNPDDPRIKDWKITLYLPQLVMETPWLNTQEYANDLVDMIMEQDNTCPHCSKNIEITEVKKIEG